MRICVCDFVLCASATTYNLTPYIRIVNPLHEFPESENVETANRKTEEKIVKIGYLLRKNEQSRNKYLVL